MVSAICLESSETDTLHIWNLSFQKYAIHCHCPVCPCSQSIVCTGGDFGRQGAIPDLGGGRKLKKSQAVQTFPTPRFLSIQKCSGSYKTWRLNRRPFQGQPRQRSEPCNWRHAKTQQVEIEQQRGIHGPTMMVGYV